MRRAGPWAGVFAVALAVMSVMPLVQFRPGRIDHHNAQILCAVAGLMFLVRSLEEERIGWIAGALIGLGLAVGYEAIGLVVPALGLAAIVALVGRARHRRRCARRHGGDGRAAGGAGRDRAALALARHPLRCAVAQSAAARRLLRGGSVGARCACRLAWGPSAGSASRGCARRSGAVLYGLIEPACLMGPFGQVNPALKPIWLDRVMESKSILSFGDNQYRADAGVRGLRGRRHRRAIRDLARAAHHARTRWPTALIVLAAMLGCWQIKLMLYASWLAVLPLAVFAARLERARLADRPAASASAPSCC